MKKYLFVCGRYFPKASPNSICVKNIIEELQKKQCSIRILCYKDGMDDHSEIAQMKISRGFVQSTLYKLEDGKGSITKVAFNLLTLIQKAKQISFFPIWPLCDPIVTLREIRVAEEMYQKEKYDTLVAVHVPLSSLITGFVMKKKHPEIKYIAYFLDSLSGGLAPRFMKKETFERKAITWEKYLLKNADNVVFMEASREYHEKIYKGKDELLPISYLDLPMLKEISYMNGEKNGEKNGETFVYVGSLSPAVRSPEFFLRVFSSVNYKDWRLFFIGDNNCSVLNEYAEKDNRITVLGRCTYEEAMKYEEQATVLINLGNKNPNLTPSKVFEYMALGKRIVSTYPINNESSIHYLKRYPAALLLDERGDVQEAADKLISFLEESHERITYDKLKIEFYANTPEAFVELIG